MIQDAVSGAPADRIRKFRVSLVAAEGVVDVPDLGEDSLQVLGDGSEARGERKGIGAAGNL